MWLIAGLLALLMLGCETGTPGNPSATPGADTGSQRTTALANPNEAVVVALRLDRQALAGALRLRWLELNDSRCPRGVECVWEGEVTVTLEVASEGGARSTVELSLRPGSAAGARVFAGHELRLLDVTPYPRSGVTPERDEYVAEIEVRSA